MSTTTSTTTTITTTAKTLPMKFKAMHYALLAFINQSDEFTAVQKVSLIAKLPVFDTIENQVLFYEKMVDFKIVEKEIVKPMIKKGKQDSVVPVLKVKKPRATKKQKLEVVTATVTATTTDLKLHLPVLDEVKAPAAPAVIEVAAPAAPSQAPVIEVAAAEVAVVKKKRAVKKIVQKKTATVLPKQEENEEQRPNEEMMLLTDEMKEEPYHSHKIERPVLKRALNKIVDIDVDHWLIFREGIKYWTTDEHEQNGLVYDYDQDQDGDGAPGAIVGKLVNGKLILN